MFGITKSALFPAKWVSGKLPAFSEKRRCGRGAKFALMTPVAGRVFDAGGVGKADGECACRDGKTKLRELLLSPESALRDQ
jgi:hypothetical protein